MKRIVGLFLAFLLLAGCTGKSDQLDRAMALRAKLLAHDVSFRVTITADYGNISHKFVLDCTGSTKGELRFTVAEPESISGIAGSISSAGGKLTFDDQVLSFPLLADDQLAPICGPWVLMKALRSGYLTSCSQEGEHLRLAIDDSYEDDALHLDIWIDANGVPIRGEILYEGRRILTMDVGNFTYL